MLATPKMKFSILFILIYFDCLTHKQQNLEKNVFTNFMLIYNVHFFVHMNLGFTGVLFIIYCGLIIPYKYLFLLLFVVAHD